MTTIDRRSFTQGLAPGVDLEAPALQQGLRGTGVSPEALRRLERTGDGRLSGGELAAAHDLVERLDARAGAAVHRALLAAREGPGARAEAIVASALERIARDGPGYALDAAPTSPHPQLTGNQHPERTRLGWLEGYNKCNQFVGDVLTQAGVAFPTHRMPDGSRHYVAAEQVLHHPEAFARVGALRDARPGDVLLVDLPGRGDSRAHLEVLVAVAPDGQSFVSAGAHVDGASVGTAYVDDLLRARYDARTRSYVSGDTRYHLLRPTRDLELPR